MIESAEGGIMALQVVCTCGYRFQADDEDGLWAKAEAHVASAHPDMVGKVERADIIAQAELV